MFLVFNRPTTTRRVFDEIRKAKPPRLYIAADGPREGRDSDFKKCAEVRDVVANVDWECEVKTLYRGSNVGCKLAVSSGINWFFENEEEGIVLEDDCLPSQSFFEYCDAQLERFRFDCRVFLVSGYNKQNVWKDKECDYFFSNYGGIWGWATWRRAWIHNDIEMRSLDQFYQQGKFTHLLGVRQGDIRYQQMVGAKKGHGMSAWDYQWGFSRHVNSGMACVPSRSLIENIGFGDDATHTFSNVSAISVVRQEMVFPLAENKFVVVDRDYDELFFEVTPMRCRIYNRIKSLFKRNI